MGGLVRRSRLSCYCILYFSRRLTSAPRLFLQFENLKKFKEVIFCPGNDLSHFRWQEKGGDKKNDMKWETYNSCNFSALVGAGKLMNIFLLWGETKVRADF